MKAVIATWVASLFLHGFCAAGVDKMPLDLDLVYRAMWQPGVEVTTVFEDCGEVNAYYHPVTKSVTMCNELLDLDPGFVRFVYAHELAHAAIVQLNLPYTGLHETAADEMAAVVLSLYDREEDVEAAGRVFFEIGELDAKLGEPVESWYDPHPGHKRRGAALVCLAAGSKGKRATIKTDDTWSGTYFCPSYEWVRARDTWMRLLGYQ